MPQRERERKRKGEICCYEKERERCKFRRGESERYVAI